MTKKTTLSHYTAKLAISSREKNKVLYYENRGTKRRPPIANIVTLNLVSIFVRTVQM